MFIIAGLGNPGKEYEGTRHNVGFDVIDRLADQYNISVEERKHRAFCGKGIIAGQKVLLVKPQTYMNLSGESIRRKGVPGDIMESRILLHRPARRNFSGLRLESEKSRSSMIWLTMCLDIFPEQSVSRWRKVTTGL